MLAPEFPQGSRKDPASDPASAASRKDPASAAASHNKMNTFTAYFPAPAIYIYMCRFMTPRIFYAGVDRRQAQLEDPDAELAARVRASSHGGARAS